MLIQEKNLINTYARNLEVNKAARKLRHKRNFSRTNNLKSVVSRVFSPPHTKGGSVAKRYAGSADRIVSQSKILKRAAAFAVFLVLVTSFTPNVAFSEGDFVAEYVSYAGVQSSIIADDSGFIIPVNPQTGVSDRSEMSDRAIYTVQSGDTLSTIAETYTLNTTTVMWENGLSKYSTLKVGQELVIPPVNGVTHEVKSGQTLVKVAALYDVDKETIIKQNNLNSEEVAAGDRVFIPGGEILAPPTPVIASSSSRTGTARTASTTRVALVGTNAAPVIGKSLIYPTRGKVTQGYRGYHLALDIGDRSKPPVWAAAGGTVVKASSGTWGGGYGNHVIVDHGNGLKTLYAHMDYLTVTKDQYVTQGEVVGRMGNTGRVYGATGIHLHFEVHANGIKKNPWNYL